MAEFIVPGEQTVDPGKPFTLITSIGCPKGYVIHREGSGILTLRGIVTNPCASFARYLVLYSGNIAIPTGQTVGEISVGLDVDGEPVNGTISKITPAAVEEFGSVAAYRYVTVPRGCCYNLSLDNQSDIPVTGDEQISVIVARTA